MRILQLIPALLLAITPSFVSATAIDARSPTDIAPASVPRSGNAAVQDIVQIISEASRQLEPLNKQLAATNSAQSAGTPDPAAAWATVEKMRAIVSNANTRLKAVPPVDSSELKGSSDLTQVVHGLLDGLLDGLLSSFSLDHIASGSDVGVSLGGGCSGILGILGIIICIL